MKKATSLLTIVTILSLFISCNSGSKSSKQGATTASDETFKITQVQSDNGSYSVTPEIPADSMVAAGRELTITATPADGYSLDCIYYTVLGGMWGTTSYEFFTPEKTVTVEKDMSIGATFVETSLVENINVTHDIVYAKPGVKPLKYDVYSPDDAENLPCIVIIHGGGWSSNNEDIMRGLARELLKGGQYVVFSIDYRWINDGDGDEVPNNMHDLISDVFGAIAHIQEHAAEYGGDATRIAVTGDSAGGHLSASAATLCTMIGDGGFGEQEGVYEFMPTYLPEGKTADQVREEITGAIKAAAPSYGVFYAENFAQFLSQTDQAYWDAVSPIKHVPNISERAIPHFLTRGTEDALISDEIVQSYTDALEAAGQKAEYIQIEGVGHAFFDWKPDARTRTTFAEYGVKYAAMMKDFFNEVFY
ncbi:alpha/beta hydrolase [uncultured Draconibacterium sp.]|uniref:alpha/beta hydrolase n=1 Tax=uncultured Draconibacterium sp. TaxID=1573823 RepID=UPI002AA7ACF3|nr:alpha/beta hydrolase [uncultured Draconibacterium sp.]